MNLYTAVVHFGHLGHVFQCQVQAETVLHAVEKIKGEWPDATIGSIADDGPSLPYLDGFGAVLAAYRCDTCGADGVKLWREPHGTRPLSCAACLGVEVDENGRYQRTDQINGWLPAVPLEVTGPHAGFWGYSSVPVRGVDWWRALPSKEGER